MCTFTYFHLHWIRQVKKCWTIGKYVMCQSEEYGDWWIKTKQTNPFLLFIGWRLRKRETASSALEFNHQLVSRGWFGGNTVAILIKNGQSKFFKKNSNTGTIIGPENFSFKALLSSRQTSAWRFHSLCSPFHHCGTTLSSFKERNNVLKMVGRA